MEEHPQDNARSAASDAAGAESKQQAVRLWDALQVVHADLNNIARRKPQELLAGEQIDSLNGIFSEVLALLEPSGRGQDLHSLDQQQQTTVIDALILLGRYRGSLRDFRITVLGQEQFSF